MASSVADVDPLAVAVRVTDTEIEVGLADGRRVAAPLAWFPRLLHASAEERERFELIGDGEGIHWPEIDEDLSVRGLLLGRPSVELGRQEAGAIG